MPKRKTDGIDSDTLRKLQQASRSSDLLEARLEFAEPEQLLKHFIKPLVGVERIDPHMLPTQASGRWSTTNAPLVNFPPDCVDPRCEGKPEHLPGKVKGCQGWSARDIVLPDPSTAWLCWDYDAIEARLAAAYSADREDLDAFNKGWDIHTLTACRLFGLPLTPDLANPHTSDVGAAWREQVGWQGKEDRRRHLAKTGRYAMTYGTDETALLQARDVEKLGLTRDELLKFGRRYLAAKPALSAAKRKAWDEIAKTGMSRTFLGMRRMLYMAATDHGRYRETGRPCEAQRQGWNHKIQGAVAGIMNLV